MLTVVNHSLSLVALHCFPHLPSSNHKCAHPLLTAVQRRTSVSRSTGVTLRNSKACGSPSHYACGSWRRSYSFLVIALCLDLQVHPSECNKEYCISLTLERFITAMVLHFFVYHVCVILAHIWDAFGFLVKSGVTWSLRKACANHLFFGHQHIAGRCWGLVLLWLV
jgi:hypothetical protein